MGAVAVICLRLFVPLSILRWPLAGLLASIAADAWDSRVGNAFGGWPLYEGMQYQLIDKLFDLYYLTLALLMSRRWVDALARKTAAFLYLWRFAGVAVFEFLHVRQVLLFAPSVFESFYLIVAGAALLAPSFRVRKGWRLALLLGIAVAPKLAQEYFLHFPR